jgi:hypothetical protein
MYFLIHSSQTGKWLFSASDNSLLTSQKDKWIEDKEKAMKFQTPAEALTVASALSNASKAHMVMFDGQQFWNLNLSKAIW